MESSLDSEYKLIEQARHDPDAFAELYRRYFNRVFAYVAYRVVRVQDAEDVVSDVFIQVVKSLRQFEYRGTGSFTAWLFRIAHLRIKQFHHQRKRKPQPLSIEELPDIQSRTTSPDMSLLRKEQFVYLSDLISTLSPRRQEIVTLRFFGELTNHEIAEVLGLNERTVSAHLSRALDDLQRMYKQEITS